jgi:hypothetical protein
MAPRRWPAPGDASRSRVTYRPAATSAARATRHLRTCPQKAVRACPSLTCT